MRRAAVVSVVLSFLLGAALLAWRRKQLRSEIVVHRQASSRSIKGVLESDYIGPLRDSHRGKVASELAKFIFGC